MSTSSVSDAAWLEHPFVYRNNRGVAKLNGRYVRYGIPEPSGHESDTDMKGGDFIGFDEVVITPDMVGKTVAVFTSIEIKGRGDRAKPGQIRWHNFVLAHGGRSEFWIEHDDGKIEIKKGVWDNDSSR